MTSLRSEFLREQPISHDLVRTIRLIGEYRGKQALFAQQAPRMLENLREHARIESVESSNRIEGVVASPNRLKVIVRDGGAPVGRSEQEIAGYCDVLATIHASHEHIPVTPNVILQLHRDLYALQESGFGGHWKATDNEIVETLPDGSRAVRFRPTPAWRTPEAMAQLCDRFRELRDAGEVDPLLLIPTFVLDFLCIHPFAEGNGRMSRLLTLLLLYQSGYEVGRYISLERIIEEQKEGYYETLRDASQGWHEDRHSLRRWWDYFLGVVLLSAYREFEIRVSDATTRRGAKRELVIDAIRRLPREFRFADVQRVCPDVSRPTIKRVFGDLKHGGLVRPVSKGAFAVWEKTGEDF